MLLQLMNIYWTPNWNVMTHVDERVGKWRGNWLMEWVANTLHTTSEHVVSSVTTAYAHTSAASSRLNWHPCRFKWTRPFRRKTKSGFRACAITFQTQSKYDIEVLQYRAIENIPRAAAFDGYTADAGFPCRKMPCSVLRLRKELCVCVCVFVRARVCMNTWELTSQNFKWFSFFFPKFSFIFNGTYSL